VQNVAKQIAQNNAQRLSNPLSLSIIVPVLNERQRLPDLVGELQRIGAEQIIIVDGGSTDGSIEWLKQHWESLTSKESLTDKKSLTGRESLTNQSASNELISSDPGRAKQMNAGVQHAKHEMLLFLHADTVLPDQAKELICQSAGSLINLRSRISGVATGDQAIFVHRQLFDQVGGFDNIALMEDVAISKKLRALVKPTSLIAKVSTSARRWQRDGIARTVLKMWWYRLAYFLGVSPDYLAKGYRNVR